MPRTAAIIGAGPAGLMAAEILSAHGLRVTVFDRMPSVGRKFLMAGRGGLNLTHSEDFETFVTRYGEAAAALRPMLEAFPPTALVAWAEGLGQKTFIGSSGRVFPKAMKASPLLRAWLARLNEHGVTFRLRHTWRGWSNGGALAFRDATGATIHEKPDVTILALGGASWPKLGSDGGWVPLLEARGVPVAKLKPANSGFTVAWSEIFRTRFAGQPIKNASFRFDQHSVRGEAVITQTGIEGGAIYALSAPLRDAVATDGRATLHLDLRPELSTEHLVQRLSRPRGKASLANHLRKTLNLSPLESHLLREGTDTTLPSDPQALAMRIKNIELTLTGTASLERAISTAGGIPFAALDESLMLKAIPGLFAAGEMLDWEAPTGGYLLQACFATGAAAAKGALAWLKTQQSKRA